MLHWLYPLPVLLLLALLGWLYAYRHNNVNIVDSLWPLFFLVSALFYMASPTSSGAAEWLLLGMVSTWSLRLALHLAWRNAGKTEDRRYATMRARNPQFSRNSLLTVFGLQATLAWFISLPLATALHAPTPLSTLHLAAALLFVTGLLFQSIADWQLSRFRNDPRNRYKVLDSGLWSLSRHPNYFGEACIWWSFYLFALAAGYAWTLISPLLMTFLLLRVSGVALLEKDIGSRRPAYQRYIERTSAFIPWFPKPGRQTHDPRQEDA